MTKSTKYSNVIPKLNRGVHTQSCINLSNYGKCMGKQRFSKN